MRNSPKSHHVAPDAPEYVHLWACDILAAVGKRLTLANLGDYKAIAGNKRMAKRDRKLAAERAKALAEIL